LGEAEEKMDKGEQKLTPGKKQGKEEFRKSRPKSENVRVSSKR